MPKKGESKWVNLKGLTEGSHRTLENGGTPDIQGIRAAQPNRESPTALRKLGPYKDDQTHRKIGGKNRG